MLTGLFTGRVKSVRLPIFPLKTVLYPGGLLPLRVFEQRYMDMVKGCLKDEQPFGICVITAGPEVGGVAQFETIGTLARILSWDMPQLGILNLVTVGGSRFKIDDHETTEGGLAKANVTLLREEDAASAPEAPATLVELLEKLIEKVGEEHFATGRHFDDANWVSYRLAEILPIKLTVKQKLLEVNDSEVRLRVITEFLRLQGILPR
ncbi:MAG: LON peptidase substrate-binding domain-containing protein [Betaproteobacteria bacterium]